MRFMKILDPDRCIAILRDRIQLSDHALPAEALAMTSISVGERVHGVLKSPRAAENLLELGVPFDVLMLNDGFA